MQWLRQMDVKMVALERECIIVNPALSIPRPHISDYAHCKTRPTPAKAAVLSAATHRIAASLGRPDDGLTVADLLYPHGLPGGAVLARDGDGLHPPADPDCDEAGAADNTDDRPILRAAGGLL